MRRRIGSERSNLGEHSSTSIVRMSTEAMWLTRLKNEHERWRYNKLMKQLLSSEKIVKHHTEKELELLKDDYLKMLAYGSVYKEFSFGKYDSARSDDSHTRLQSQDFRSTAFNSSNEGQAKHNQSTQCHELPLIHNNNSKNEATNGKRSPWARLKSPRTRLPSGEDIISLVRPKAKLLSCSDIETNDSNKILQSNCPSASNKDVGVETKNSNVSQRPKSVSWTDPLTTNEDADNKASMSPRSQPRSVTDQLETGSSSSASPAKSLDGVVREEVFNVPPSPKPLVKHEDDESEEDKRCKLALMSALAIKLQALIMWRQKMSHPKLEKSSSARQRVRRNVTEPSKPKIRERPHTLFPGDCKTVWAMKKFMDKEADSKLSMLNSAPKRNRAKLDKLIEKVKLPDLIDRGKSTSAIFRDFKLYKDSQKDEVMTRDEQVTQETTRPLLLDDNTSIVYKL